MFYKTMMLKKIYPNEESCILTLQLKVFMKIFKLKVKFSIIFIMYSSLCVSQKAKKVSF